MAEYAASIFHWGSKLVLFVGHLLSVLYHRADYCYNGIINVINQLII